MKKIDFLKSLVVGCMLMLGSFDAATAQMVPPPLPADTALVTGTLPNGLTYFIYHNEKPKDRANFYIAQRVGSILEEDSQSGLAHFLEHMAFNGTKNFPGKKLINYLQSIGVKFGADLNAYTAFDETVYTVMDAPTDKKGVVDSCLLIMHDWSNNITLDPKEIDAERGVIHEEWRQRDTGNLRVFANMLKAAFPNNKYAKRMPIGSMDVIDNFKHKELRDYYQKWYRPDLQAIIVVGDIDAKAVESKLIEIFKDIPKPVNPAKREYTKVEINKEPISGVLTDPEATGTRIMISFKTEPMPDEIKATQFGIVQDYLVELLSNMINVRFEEIARKPNAPFLDAGTYYSKYMQVANTMDAFNFEAIAKDGGYKDAMKALAMEISRLRQYGFTQGEFSRGTKALMAKLKNQYNERNKRDNSKIANEYVSYFTKGGNLCSVDMKYQICETVSQQLNLASVNSALKEILPSEGMGIFVLGPAKKDIKYPNEKELLTQFSEFLKEPVEAYKDKVSDAKLIDKVPQKGKIVKEEKGQFDSKIWTLGNGAKVIVKKTDFKEDEIAMRAVRNGGILSVSDKDIYNAKFFNEVVNEVGLGKYSKDDIEKILSGKIASISTRLSSEYSELSGKTTKEDLETMMQLLYLNFTEKRKDNDAFKSMKEKYISSLDMKDSNPMSSFSDSVSMAMYGNDPRYNSLKKEDFSLIDYNRIMDMYKEYFSGADGFTFFFIGNYDEAKLKEYVQTYIASLPKGKVPNVKNMPEKQLRRGLYKNFYSKKLTNPVAVVFSSYPGNIGYNQENAMALDIFSEIMDQVYIESLREQEGGTYGASTQSELSDNPKDEAQFLYVFQTSPEKALHLDNIAEKQLQEVVKKGVNKTMYDKVIENMYKAHAQNIKENKYWLNNLIKYYQKGYDNVTNWENTVKAMTPEKVRAVAEKLLKQNNQSKVILYTEGHELKAGK